MACRTLLRRKTQLALLTRACEAGAPALVRLRRKAAFTGKARLQALERDGVLVSGTGNRIEEVELAGQPVEVCFEHRGEHYVFFAVTRGRVGRDRRGKVAQVLVKLSLPLRLERARRRPRLHLPLTGEPPIRGTFTHVVDSRRQFEGELTDIADGGMGVTAGRAEVSPLCTGDLYWLDLKLPGDKSPLEFVVRLVHVRPVKDGEKLAMGWAFQPTDDLANYERYLRRLESFIARQQSPGTG